MYLNKKRKEALKLYIEQIEANKDEIESLMDDEECAKDGLEEHFSETDRYLVMENNVEYFQDAITLLEETIDLLNSIE